MQIFSNAKNFFTAGLLLLLLACNSNSAKEKTTDKKQTDPIAPATTAEPKAVITEEIKKCYANDGLKYKTVITIIFGIKNEVSGNVTSEEIESGKKETTAFEGTSDDWVKFTIKFKGTPPVIGSASEWTDKPWTIKQLEGKGQWMERLHITFNAKNYDTNKWEDSDYQFVMVECK